MNIEYGYTITSISKCSLDYYTDAYDKQLLIGTIQILSDLYNSPVLVI